MTGSLMERSSEEDLSSQRRPTKCFRYLSISPIRRIRQMMVAVIFTEALEPA